MPNIHAQMLLHEVYQDSIQNEIVWELKTPPLLSPHLSKNWLQAVSALRGWVLYENGRRPSFKTGDNQFSDSDDLDSLSYHILAYLKGKIIGCIRLLPLPSNSSFNCVIRQEIGGKEFNLILKDIYLIHEQGTSLSEASRWIVDPKFKHYPIGSQLIYGIWALSFHLNTCFIANGGLNAYKLVEHFGAVDISCGKQYFSEKYNDNLHVFYFDKNRLSAKILKSINKMAEILKISDVLKMTKV